MRARRLLGAVAVGLIGIALPACGGGGPDACGLLTEAEAERILDTTVRAPEPEDESLGPGSTCAWISEDSTTDPQAPVYGVSITLHDDEEARRDFARTRSEPSGDWDVVEVDGLGDAAFFVEYTDQVPTLPDLYVRAGDHVLLVGTYDSDERPVTAAEARRMQRAAARAALSHL